MPDLNDLSGLSLEGLDLGGSVPVPPPAPKPPEVKAKIEELTKQLATAAAPKAEKSWTDQQYAIFAKAASPKSLMIPALAGTGKTTTIVELAQHLPRVSTLCCAFNKKNADELAKRMPPHFVCKTMNSIGATAFNKAISRKCIVDKDKVGDLVNLVAKEFGYDRLPEEEWSAVTSMVRMARHNGLIPNGIPLNVRGLIPDEVDTWTDIADKLLIDNVPPEIITMCRRVLVQCVMTSMQGKVDFDDQIYMSALVAGFFEKYEIVIVDEAQDLSPLNHIQLKKSLQGPTARLIVVGDPKQAIYAFRGADSSSMASMRALRPDWEDLPLSVTFRCPKVVVKRQLSHAPNYVAAPTNREGTFTKLSYGWTFKDVMRIAEGNFSIGMLCRMNAPIVSMAFKLIREGVGCTVLGRDIGKNLANLAKKICGEDLFQPASHMIEKIMNWQERETVVAQAAKKEEKVASIRDRAECLLAVIDSGGAGTLGELLGKIHFIFEESQGRVTLATGHKAKGMEWETVVHLDPFRVPSKWARQALEAGNPVPYNQDMNLKYVIETRAQGNLIEANLEHYGEGT